MLKKITLKNFQSHKHSEIEFSDKLNIFIGATDSGKSVVMRAFKWVIKNKPNNNSRTRRGASSCEVSIDIDNCTIKRKRTNSDNIYTLNGDVLKAFGMNTPEEVTDAFDINPVSWQEQHDSMFLLANTGREISKYLNSIIGLDNIDNTIKNINKKYLNTKQELKLREKDKLSILNELNKYDWLEEYSSNITELEIIINTYNVLCSDIEDSEKILINFVSLPNDKTILINILLNYYDEINSIVNTLNTININELYKILNNYNSCNTINLENIEINIDKLNFIYNNIEELKVIRDNYYKWDSINLNNIETDLNTLINKIKDMEELERLKTDIIKVEKSIKYEELHKLEEVFNKHINICPLCGNRRENV